MGRYFLYRMHPLSVAELLNQTLLEEEIRPPQKLADKDFETLLTFG
jgi:predicted AAA+ superfamily ATPase